MNKTYISNIPEIMVEVDKDIIEQKWLFIIRTGTPFEGTVFEFDTERQVYHFIVELGKACEFAKNSLAATPE